MKAPNEMPKHWMMVSAMTFVCGVFFADWNLLAPVHEIFHVIAAMLSGSGWSKLTWSHVYIHDPTVFSLAAGYFGETLLWFCLVIAGLIYAKVWVAAFFVGYLGRDAVSSYFTVFGDFGQIGYEFGASAELTVTVVWHIFSTMLFLYAIGATIVAIAFWHRRELRKSRAPLRAAAKSV